MDWCKRKLRQLAWWLLQTVHPAEEEIDVVLRAVWGDVGLPLDAYHRDFDLLHSGKFHDVLILASRRLGNPLITLDHVRELLK